MKNHAERPPNAPAVLLSILVLAVAALVAARARPGVAGYTIRRGAGGDLAS